MQLAHMSIDLFLFLLFLFCAVLIRDIPFFCISINVCWQLLTLRNHLTVRHQNIPSVISYFLSTTLYIIPHLDKHFPFQNLWRWQTSGLVRIYIGQVQLIL